MGAWPIALSVMATQCSTNSILGAPAFVAFAAGGGLIWLQYELALPLAMIVLMLLFMPQFRRAQLVSVYEFLEQRFDRKTRLHLSGLFLFVRAFATAVTVYGIALVIDLITGVGFTMAVILLGVFTIIYDVIGGIKGVVYSDVIQLIILVSVLLLVFYLLVDNAGGLSAMFQAVPSERTQTLNFDAHGLGDGENFGFWPMLFGGLFLYVSYYGCDQSQVQRELCARDLTQTNKALFINGLLRFPLVALYCFVGIGIAAYAINQPDFLALMPSADGTTPNYNLAVPTYIIHQLPVGIVGLALVALFAAAMSSLDSVLNSLSAATMEDFVRTRQPNLSAKKELWISRLITTLWGITTLTMAFFVDDIASTILEAINKVGSLANGPILAVFTLALFARSTPNKKLSLWVRIGFWSGIICNGLLWIYAESISWLWWNVSGFFITIIIGMLGAKLALTPKQGWGFKYESNQDSLTNTPTVKYSLGLLGLFCLLLMVLASF
jgi:SSS family transporter